MNSEKTVKTFNNDIILRFIIDSRYRVFRHFSLILLLGAGVYDSEVEFPEPFNTFAKIGFFFMLLSLFYINMYRLVPKFLFKENYLGYFLWILVLFVLIQLIGVNLQHYISPYIKPLYKLPHEKLNPFAFSFAFIILIGASAAVKLFQRWIIDSHRINELETNTTQSELEHLKKQINPHFLFNTLNNANVLIQKDPDKASQILMKLSDLLRYQLYDSARNKVFLSADINFLEDFLNLEKVRRDDFDFSITKQGAFMGLEIAPLLFITFVENAVKHNIDAEGPSFVNLLFTVIGNELNFHCINSKPRIKVAKRSTGGLGLANVTRRLQLLYPDKHKLMVADNVETFNVHLMIKI